MPTPQNPMAVMVLVAISAFSLVSYGNAATSHANEVTTPTASPQIVFSAMAEPSFFTCQNATCSGPAQFGFWIWCTAPSSTNDGDCRGSMWFFNMRPYVVPVTGTAALTGTTATVKVSSSLKAAISVACTLVNNSLLPGRKNTVMVTCGGSSWTKPGPSGASTTNDDAIVQIAVPPPTVFRPHSFKRAGEPFVIFQF